MECKVFKTKICRQTIVIHLRQGFVHDVCRYKPRTEIFSQRTGSEFHSNEHDECNPEKGCHSEIIAFFYQCLLEKE